MGDTQWVYDFSEGSRDMRDLLGGKGANVAEMTRVLGVDPPRQGEGLGSALMQPVLELCDRERVPAYLESSKERNVDFYARHGFRVTSELRLPKGPAMWPMWRNPHQVP